MRKAPEAELVRTAQRLGRRFTASVLRQRGAERAVLEAVEEGRRAAFIVARAARERFTARLSATDPALVEAFKEFLQGYEAPSRWQAHELEALDAVATIEGAIASNRRIR